MATPLPPLRGRAGPSPRGPGSDVGGGPAAEARPALECSRARRLSARRPRPAAGAVLAGGYLGAVGVFAAVRGPAGLPRPQALAATPAALASGKLWLLVTSAFVVSGPPPLELAAVGRIVHDPDFGISAVWMGVLGALLGG